MPAFAGPLVGFSLGALLARWSRGPRGLRGSIPLLLFGALVLAPVCAYPLLFFPDWAYAYAGDSRKVPSALVLALILLDIAAPAAGHFIARRALAREALGEDAPAHAAALALVLGPVGVAALLSVALAPRLATVGNLAMVRGDFGTAALWRSPLGYSLVWMAACLGAGAWLTARALSAIAKMDGRSAAGPKGLDTAKGASFEPSAAKARRLGAGRKGSRGRVD